MESIDRQTCGWSRTGTGRECSTAWPSFVIQYWCTCSDPINSSAIERQDYNMTRWKWRDIQTKSTAPRSATKPNLRLGRPGSPPDHQTLPTSYNRKCKGKSKEKKMPKVSNFDSKRMAQSTTDREDARGSPDQSWFAICHRFCMPNVLEELLYITWLVSDRTVKRELQKKHARRLRKKIQFKIILIIMQRETSRVADWLSRHEQLQSEGVHGMAMFMEHSSISLPLTTAHLTSGTESKIESRFRMSSRFLGPFSYFG